MKLVVELPATEAISVLRYRDILIPEPVRTFEPELVIGDYDDLDEILRSIEEVKEITCYYGYTHFIPGQDDDVIVLDVFSEEVEDLRMRFNDDVLKQSIPLASVHSGRGLAYSLDAKLFNDNFTSSSFLIDDKWRYRDGKVYEIA